jgi:hypothetical protein
MPEGSVEGLLGMDAKGLTKIAQQLIVFFQLQQSSLVKHLENQLHTEMSFRLQSQGVVWEIFVG